MWLVLKMRLTVPIALAALLASLLLLVEVCMLQSSGNCELYKVRDSHRKSISDGHLLSSVIVFGNGIMEGNRSRSLITDEVDGVDHVLAEINVSNITSELIELKSGVEQNKTLVSLINATNDAQSHATLAQSVTDLSIESSSSSVRYKQIPKSAVAMLQFLQAHHCTEPHCMDYLTSYDKECYNYCVKKGQLNSKSVHNTGMHGECRFMRGEGRAAVALASLPGSGNTWVRGLIEKATGICTGECLLVS